MEQKPIRRLPGKLTSAESAASIISELIADCKRAIKENAFTSGVWIMIDMGQDMRLERAPGSEIIFDMPGINKRETIKRIARAMVKVIQDVINPKATIYCIVVTADAFIDKLDIPAGKDRYEYLKEINYTRPSQQPQHDEALIVVTSFREKEILYTYRYSRVKKQILFDDVPETEIDPVAGFITKLFPDDL
jgi:hypothetical protein